MSAKHTPGPWRIDRHLGCIVGQGGGPIGGEADLTLAAAAPELLHVIERAVRRLEIAHANGDTIMREWIVDARAAIAKATGEAA